MKGFLPSILYVCLFAALPLVFATVKSASLARLRDGVFARSLAKDYLRTFPAVALVLLPVLAFPRVAPKYLAAMHFAFALPLCLEIGHVWRFGTRVGLNTFYSLFATNSRETREFFAQNVSAAQIALIAAVALVPPPLIWLFLPEPSYTAAWARPAALVAAFLRNLMRPQLKRKDGYVMNPYTNLAYHYALFRRSYRELRRMIAERAAPPFEGVSSSVPADVPETYVIVVGESANSQHCSYCGYRRDTNEFTDALGGRMLRFRGVFSPFAQTIPSLERVLTFADAAHPERVYSTGSIIDYFNAAGFETTWYSNQYALDDTALTALASHAKSSRSFNFSGMKRFEKAGLDGDMLPAIREALHGGAAKKAVFVHLIGSHSAYVNRYPDEFRKFSGQPPGRNLAPSKAALVNSYDDSMRYTDWVVSEIARALEPSGGVSYMLYFSDHGEDVFDSTDGKMLGHSQLANAPMTSVPFMLYLSPGLDAMRPDIRSRAASAPERYALEDLVHTVIDLSSLSGPMYEKDRSILGARPETGGAPPAVRPIML